MIGFAVATIGLGSYATARWTPLFAVRSIEVVGVDRHAAARVRNAVADLHGRSLVALPAEEVQRRVSRLPDVVGASYDRSFPHTLVLFVEPERPVAVLRRGAESWLVSARARAIRRLQAGERPTLPRIWVHQTVGIDLGALVSDTDTLRAIRTLALPGIAALPVRVRTARIDRRDATLVLRSGLEIRLGRDVALPLKLAIARRIIPRLGTPSAGTTLYLDLSVPERPVAGEV
jgi:cell division protein FtsQ